MGDLIIGQSNKPVQPEPANEPKIGSTESKTNRSAQVAAQHLMKAYQSFGAGLISLVSRLWRHNKEPEADQTMRRPIGPQLRDANKLPASPYGKLPERRPIAYERLPPNPYGRIPVRSPHGQLPKQPIVYGKLPESPDVVKPKGPPPQPPISEGSQQIVKPKGPPPKPPVD